jgi:hypothetical protein
VVALSRLIGFVKRQVERLAPATTALLRQRMLRRHLKSRRRPLPIQPQHVQAPVVLFFAPDAGLVPHFVTHLIAARTLKELGHRVLVVRCYQHLRPRCIVMEANALPVGAVQATSDRICEGCVRTSLSMVYAYGLEVVDLDDVIDDGMRAQLRAMMAGAPEDLRQFSIGGAAIGQLANGDLSRILKINNPAEIAGAVRDHLRQYVETAAVCYLATQRLCERLNVSRLVYFNDYAMTLAAEAAAREINVPTTHLSHVPLLNNDRRRIVMLSGYAPLEGLRRLRNWPGWRNFALPPDVVALISEDSFLRFAGKGFTIYSPAWTATAEGLFDRLALNRRRRLLVAYTSSEDEIRALRFHEEALGVEVFPGKSVFTDQFDWLQSLVEHVEPSADLQLVIRVHPREAPNHRENRTSENLREIKRRFSGAYQNVRIVWPGDPISSYDLAEIADLGLIALSSIGLELVRLGVPVIASFPHMAEAPEGTFVAWGDTREGYFAAVRRAVDDPVSLDRVIAAFRWMNGRFLQYSVDCSDIVPTRDYDGLPSFRMPQSAHVMEEVLIAGRSLPDINDEQLARCQRHDSADRERKAIVRHLSGFLYFLVFGVRADADFRLNVMDDACGARVLSSCDNDFSATVSGSAVTLRGGGRSATKFSPMAARMVRLLATTAADAGAVEAQ